MKKQVLPTLFLILLGIFISLFLFSFEIKAKELTQEEIEKYVKLASTDGKDILNSLPQVMTDEWIDSVISTSIPEREGIMVIVRQAIRGKMMDYFLEEGPKELGKEVIKTGFKVGRLAMAQDISALLEEFEKMTVKESVKYLGQWLEENKTKIAFGNLDFSYRTLLEKKEKHRFQYIIIYSPETKETVIKIYSANPMSSPASRGSIGALSGVGWNYSQEQAKGKKIPSFILIIEGRMSREQGGYWGGKIIHRYAWLSQPKVTIEFSDNVPRFDFHKKSVLENLRDKIKGFFGKIGNGFSNLFGASLVNPSFEEMNSAGELSPPSGQEGESGLSQLIQKATEQIKILRKFLTDSGHEEAEGGIRDIVNEQDIENLLKEVNDIQKEGERRSDFSENLGENGGKINTEDNGENHLSEKKLLPLLINEVCAGTDSSKNEFIELYNPNSAPIFLNDDNFQLQIVSSANKDTKKRIDWKEHNVPAYSHFLLVGGNLVLDGEEIQADANFSSQMSGISGVIISDKEGNILDKLGWGSNSKSPPISAIEGQGKILINGLKTGFSLERSGYSDTNNNAIDFNLNESPSPVNSKGQRGFYYKGQDEVGTENEGGVGKGVLGGSFDNNGSMDSGNNGGENKNSASSPTRNYCSQENLDSPVHFPVIFNEIAWMGSQNSRNDEWFELKNISTSTVYLSDWQILDKSEQIKIAFNENDKIPANGFYLLERTDDESVPEVLADKVYKGSLSNTDESLRLFNSNCDLIDEIIANPNWLAGENDNKKTMERGEDLSWHTYSGPGNKGIMGTPKKGNSQGAVENEGEGEGNSDNGQDNNEENSEESSTSTPADLTPTPTLTSTPTSTPAQGLVITEVMADGSEEFVELFNPLDSEISLEGLYLSYFSSGRNWNDPYLNKPFPSSTIPAQGYYLVSFGDYPGEPDSDWSPYSSHLSDNSGSLGIFSCNPKIATTSTTTFSQAIERAKGCKIDALGWGEGLIKEGEAINPAGSGKSLSRKMVPDESGRLVYIDTNNNGLDFGEKEPTPKSRNSNSYSDLDNDGIIDSYDEATVISADRELEAGEYSFKNLIINNGANLALKSDPSLEGFKGVKISAENLVIEEGGSLNSDGYGCSGLEVLERNFSFPQTLGSGGEGNPKTSLCSARPGGPGGGAMILEIANVLENQGRISANGEDGLPSCSYGCWPTGAGEGGSIYITTNILKGSGNIIANGGIGSFSQKLGNGGQVAVYYQDKKEFEGAIYAFGGEINGFYASPGTVYLENSSQKRLIIEGQDKSATFNLTGNLTGLEAVEISGVTVKTATSTNFESRYFTMNSAVLDGPNQAFLIFRGESFSLIDSEIEVNVDISVNNLNIDRDSLISADAKGYPSDTGPGTGDRGVGGSYGGIGGINATSSVYGSQIEPKDFGSGGGGNPRNINCLARAAGAGGGAIILTSDEIRIDGILSANGEDGIPSLSYGCGPTAGGSGGSIYISTQNIEGDGLIRANGGRAYGYNGGGGGGRVSINGNRTNFIGSIEVLGGEGVFNGQEGTIYLSP